MILSLMWRAGLLSLMLVCGKVFAADTDVERGTPAFEAQLRRAGFKQADLEAALGMTTSEPEIKPGAAVEMTHLAGPEAGTYNPSTGAILSGVPEEAKNVAAETLAYLELNVSSGKGFWTAPGVTTAFQYFKDNPVELAKRAAGITIGTSAAWAWSIVFATGPNVAYFLLPDQSKGDNADSIGMPIFVFTLLPEISHNVNILNRLHFSHLLTRQCEPTPSRLHQRLTWTNRVITTLFLAKFFKVYYGATWGFEYPDGSHNADDSDYWIMLTYLWSNWWSKYDALGHKVHLIEHTWLGRGHDHHDARTLQDQLAATYRKVQTEDVDTLLPLATWIHQLNQNAKGADQKALVMMAILARLRTYGQLELETHTKDDDFAPQSFNRQPKPWSLKVFEHFGRGLATTVAPFALLGAYYTWDSVLEVVGLRPEGDEEVPQSDWHWQDGHMDREPDAWVYGLITAAYTAVAGYYTGPTWGRNLWCRWHGIDPNHFERDLQYWPQNMAGLRAIFGGGLTYLGASLLMFPIAGLATEQVLVTGGSMDLQKALLATIAQWGVVLDASFVGPHYQNVISHLGRLTGADPKGTLKDDLLKFIVNCHQSVGRLDKEHKGALDEALERFKQSASSNGETFCYPFNNASDLSSASDTTSDTNLSFDSGSDDTSSSPDTGRLNEPLLTKSPSHVPAHKLNMFQRMRNWLLGEPMPHALRAELAKAYT